MVTELPSEVRCSNRIGVRTPVVVYQCNPDGSMARARAWTDDLSTGGVKLVTENRLKESPVYIRIMLPDLKDRVIACETVREDDAILKRVENSLADRRRWSYGLRFVDVADAKVLAVITETDDLALCRKALKA